MPSPTPATRLLELCLGEECVGGAVLSRLSELAAGQQRDRDDTKLFAAQTFYALLTRLLAAKIVGRDRQPMLPIIAPTRSPESSWQWLREVESGEQLRQEAISAKPIENPYAWYLDTYDPPLALAITRLDEALERLELCDPAAERPPDDLLKALYHRLIPRQARHARGEYYTPHWLAEHLLGLLSFPQSSSARLLDPACGSGTFLLEAIRCVRQRCRREGLSPSATLAAVLDQVVGIDLDPLAVLAARTNYLMAISDLLPAASGPLTIPVYQGDSILDSFEELGRFDCIAGNPPWVGWESISPAYREATRPLWEHYGLFAQQGMATILGGGKKDLSLLMSYAVTDRLLKPGGRLGFVITQSAFKTLGAGQGFRRFEWTRGGETTSVRVERVEDLTDFQPFEIAGTRTALFVWQKGAATEYPVPYHVWQKVSRGKQIAADATLAEALERTRRLEYVAEPIRTGDRTSAWLTAPAGIAAALQRVLGPSDYRAHEGANTGGANGVYWLELLRETGDGRCVVRNIVAGAKKQVPQVEAEIERELLFPLLRGREVRRWQGSPQAMLLMVQDPSLRRGYEETQFAAEFPLAYAYLKSFEPMLRRRAAFRRYFTRNRQGMAHETGPFYSMFNIGPATFAVHKVVWHRMVAPLGAVVVGSAAGKPILPQETHAFVACDSEQEAFYLAGLMNATPLNYAALASSQAGGKSFGSPQLLQHLHLPVFEIENQAHRTLAALARGRQQESIAEESSVAPDPELDQAAAEVWQIDRVSAEKIARAMAELTKTDLASMDRGF